jgi:hypothetical protein
MEISRDACPVVSFGRHVISGKNAFNVGLANDVVTVCAITARVYH